jgi:DNA-binding NarL/FixJ family response regulator
VIRVLVADDEALVRAGLRLVVDAQPDMEVVAEADDGDCAVWAARDHGPDVVLMDIRMAGMDGLEATRRLLADNEPPRVLVLTTFDEDGYIYEALRLGASGFLLKSVPPEQLVDGIRIVAAGDSILEPSVTRRVIEAFASGKPARKPDRALEELTERELEVFKLLAEAKSNGEIAAELVITEATAKTHVAHILRKLQLRDRAQAVVRAYETGLVRA